MLVLYRKTFIALCILHCVLVLVLRDFYSNFSYLLCAIKQFLYQVEPFDSFVLDLGQQFYPDKKRVDGLWLF